MCHDYYFCDMQTHGCRPKASNGEDCNSHWGCISNYCVAMESIGHCEACRNDEDCPGANTCNDGICNLAIAFNDEEGPSDNSSLILWIILAAVVLFGVIITCVVARKRKNETFTHSKLPGE